MSPLVDTLYAQLEAEPDSWACRLALIEALLIERRPEEAIVLVEGIARLPDDIDERAIAARALGLIEPAKGLPVLEEILKISPEHPGAHFEKAFLSHRAGDIASARVHYRRAIVLDPIFKDARFESKLQAASLPGDPGPAPTDPRSEVEKAFEAGQEVSFPAPAGPEGDRNFAQEEVSAEEREAEKLFYPGPGEIPVIALRQAMAVEMARKLAAAGEAARSPSLNYARDVKPRPLAFTPAPEYFRRFRKLRIQPRPDRAAVEYDFRQPDDSLFAAPVSPDRILVGALVTEDGIAVASLQQSLRRHRQLREPAIEKGIRRNKAQSIFAGVVAVAALAALLTLISLGVARIRPPQILAKTAPQVEDLLETRVIVRQRSRHQSVTDPAAMLSTDFVRSAAVSAIGFPSIESPGTGLGLPDLGAHFGAGMDFASTANRFFGTRVQGKIAVVFDVTGSMYASIPIVVREIESRFRNAHVVAVHGSLFTDEGPRRLIPYEQNPSIQSMVGGFRIFSDAGNDLDKALQGLRRCDSMEMTSETGYLQSLGRAIELLIESKAAQTIFVFSDFEDGEDKAYLRKIAALARRARVKIVFHHPTSFGDRVTRRAYEAFVKEAGGEVKEGGLGVRRR